MELMIKYNITDCRDCCFATDYKGHGECWTECTHKVAPTFDGNILWGCREVFREVPDWCPIGLGGKHGDDT